MSAVQIMNWGDYHLYSLKNGNGTQIDVSELGATIVNFFVNDQQGNKRNIVLGYDTAQDYLNGTIFMGCVVGPWANRIRYGRYHLDGNEVTLECNEGTNHLHGASANIGLKRWHVEVLDDNAIELYVRTEAGEAGYPHAIDFRVTYELTESDELKIGYFALPQGRTPINMTQHAYFNLSPNQYDSIEQHHLQINAETYLFLDHNSIPIDRAAVANTPMDFRQSRVIAEGLGARFSQIRQAKGYDHCWCFTSKAMKKVATLTCPDRTLGLEVHTDQLGMQFYAGNHINNEAGRQGAVYQKHAALCLETQDFPDKINMKGQQECVYDATHPYHHFVTYRVTASASERDK
ncbi:galactose mutarotase [Vibrio sp. SM6]|uniref:Aldose 1-epimerase n=1 Tax=Vibrio agarilyticus TaxID=2726741 RepID=A0A7X8TMW3_9VIBR|nr:aldose epimerase family protein [Vibrio agarilyticus]NLS11676.1 galactose mutarotase [Vibrio agarilyticus]